MKPFDSSLVKGTPARILSEAAAEEEQTVSEIALEVETPQSYVGKILSDLEEEGFVESRRSEDDARKRLYTVTELGEEFLEVLEKAYAEA
ncbi:MarR family winged helix-turn-helix transcriptional regulator [Haloplanus natans]|uniref:MarR family winged helix-turn-helix transcriptional regulator n=1 Tax=Haloplanus natans TaxID=376171 RepID=UPI0006782852|nr:MarR family transcriptional regulator [Haloplanus natans]